MDATLKSYIDNIMTHLLEGERWHMRCANELRKTAGKRGFARMHDNMALHCAKTSKGLNKLLRDGLEYGAAINTSITNRAESYAINSEDDFKKHFDVWIEREKPFFQVLGASISVSAKADVRLYKKLCKLAECLKKQIMRAEWIKETLEYGNWEPHHVTVISKWIHEQAESSPHDWNFNIG